VLTLEQELAVWRKQATISMQEEFKNKQLPAGLEDSLPPNLNEVFDTVRSGVRRSAEVYINLCNLTERLSKRNEGVAADYQRFSRLLQTLADQSESVYAIDTNDIPLLNGGLNATAKHYATSQTLLEDEARAWDTGALEDLKIQRDILVGMRDMFDRKDRYARDNIPQLEKRIQNNEQKLALVRGRPVESVKIGEAERIEEAIIKVCACCRNADGCRSPNDDVDVCGYRISSPLSISMLVVSSLRNVFVTSSFSFNRRNIM
jgi:sorting nexin-8